MNYYCLIAGFPDIQLDETRAIPTLLDLKREFEEELSSEDLSLLQLIYAKFDNDNFLKYLRNKEEELNPLGSLTAEDWKELIVLMEELESPNDKRLPPYLLRFYRDYKNEDFSFGGYSQEDYLSSLYYEYAMKNKNAFLKAWFEFNLNCNNVLSAIACRKHKFDKNSLILGNNEVSQALRKSNARDFGLSAIFPNTEALVLISDEKNLLEREKQIDSLKWEWLEENTFFHYFTIEKVLSLVLKCELINRWRPLTKETGNKIFRSLLNDLKKDVNFDTEQ